jgi:hypothetical protein
MHKKRKLVIRALDLRDEDLLVMSYMGWTIDEGAATKP